MRDEFCGSRVDHVRHTWRPHWWRRRLRCRGAWVIPCGRSIDHEMHWFGENCDELCIGHPDR